MSEVGGDAGSTFELGEAESAWRKYLQRIGSSVNLPNQIQTPDQEQCTVMNHISVISK